MDEIHAQLTATTVPLTSHIEQLSQSIQQTAATTGQALERVRIVQAHTLELCTHIEGALRQQVVTVKMQAKQESQRLCAEVELVLHEQLGVAKQETIQKLGVVT